MTHAKKKKQVKETNAIANLNVAFSTQNFNG